MDGINHKHIELVVYVLITKITAKPWHVSSLLKVFGQSAAGLSAGPQCFPSATFEAARCAQFRRGWDRDVSLWRSLQVGTLSWIFNGFLSVFHGLNTFKSVVVAGTAIVVLNGAQTAGGFSSKPSF